MDDEVELTIDNHIAEVTLNRPDKHNAINSALATGVMNTIEEIEANGEVRAMILRGAGDSFCSGRDVVEAEDESELVSIGITNGMRDSIEDLKVPTIAAMHGYVLGGGLEMAACFDFRIASTDAEMGFPEINLGTIPGGGGSQRVPRLVGVPKAKELIFSGERISGNEAEEIGLVDRTTEQDELLESARAFAEKFTDKSPAALALAKMAINEVWQGSDLREGLLAEDLLSDIAQQTEDRQEGITAFEQGREPDWKGQ